MFKKAKLLVGDHSPKWYLLYSGFAALMVIGFFSIFSYYSATPKMSLTGFQAADLEFNTMKDVLNWRQPASKFDYTEEFPLWFYFSVVLVAVGITGFITTKVFYEKASKKEIAKHGNNKRAGING
jgi:hypothetical protein